MLPLRKKIKEVMELLKWNKPCNRLPNLFEKLPLLFYQLVFILQYLYKLPQDV